MLYEIANMITWLYILISTDLIFICMTSCPFPKATVSLTPQCPFIIKAHFIE